MFSKVAIIASMVALASAGVPAERLIFTRDTGAVSCGNNQVTACCDRSNLIGDVFSANSQCNGQGFLSLLAQPQCKDTHTVACCPQDTNNSPTTATNSFGNLLGGLFSGPIAVVNVDANCVVAPLNLRRKE